MSFLSLYAFLDFVFSFWGDLQLYESMVNDGGGVGIKGQWFVVLWVEILYLHQEFFWNLSGWVLSALS